MNFPDDLSYSADHLWVRLQGEQATLGISDFAQDQLGRVVYVDLPAKGDVVSAGSEMGAVESAKSVSDLIAPVSGQVVEVNQKLRDQPTLLNDDPYGQGWIAVIKLDGEPPALMSAADYKASLA